MNARTLPDSLLRARLGYADGLADRAALKELSELLLEINELAAIGARIAKASPAVDIKALWFDAIQTSVGMAWGEAERATNRLAGATQ